MWFKNLINVKHKKTCFVCFRDGSGNDNVPSPYVREYVHFQNKK